MILRNIFQNITKASKIKMQKDTNGQNYDLKNKPYTQQFCFMRGQNNTDKF